MGMKPDMIATAVMEVEATLSIWMQWHLHIAHNTGGRKGEPVSLNST